MLRRSHVICALLPVRKCPVLGRTNRLRVVSVCVIYLFLCSIYGTVACAQSDHPKSNLHAGLGLMTSPKLYDECRAGGWLNVETGLTLSFSKNISLLPRLCILSNQSYRIRFAIIPEIGTRFSIPLGPDAVFCGVQVGVVLHQGELNRLELVSGGLSFCAGMGCSCLDFCEFEMFCRHMPLKNVGQNSDHVPWGNALPTSETSNFGDFGFVVRFLLPLQL